MAQIVTLSPDDDKAVEQCARLLVDGFAKYWPDAWPDMASALEEMRECLAGERICRVALDENGEVVGWIGGIPEYDGNVWELHPLVVREDRRGQGLGRALVEDVERLVRERGAYTMTVGTDDESGMTSLSGIDLYTDTWQHIAQIKNLRGHPYEFYQKLGFTIIGVMPDANGPGKPDILMAKRV